MNEPLDLDALRDDYLSGRAIDHAFMALIAELEATRAERDEADAAHCDCCYANANAWQDALARAELAEARLRDIGWSANQEEAHGERLGVLWAERQEYIARAELAEATIGRVEAELRPEPCRVNGCPVCATEHRVRAALRGDS